MNLGVSNIDQSKTRDKSVHGLEKITRSEDTEFEKTRRERERE